MWHFRPGPHVPFSHPFHYLRATTFENTLDRVCAGTLSQRCIGSPWRHRLRKVAFLLSIHCQCVKEKFRFQKATLGRALQKVAFSMAFLPLSCGQRPYWRKGKVLSLYVWTGPPLPGLAANDWLNSGLRTSSKFKINYPPLHRGQGRTTEHIILIFGWWWVKGWGWVESVARTWIV